MFIHIKVDGKKRSVCLWGFVCEKDEKFRLVIGIFGKKPPSVCVRMMESQGTWVIRKKVTRLIQIPNSTAYFTNTTKLIELTQDIGTVRKYTTSHAMCPKTDPLGV